MSSVSIHGNLSRMRSEEDKAGHRVSCAGPICFMLSNYSRSLSMIRKEVMFDIPALRFKVPYKVWARYAEWHEAGDTVRNLHLVANTGMRSTRSLNIQFENLVCTRGTVRHIKTSFIIIIIIIIVVVVIVIIIIIIIMNSDCTNHPIVSSFVEKRH
nr:hypothetical protein BaRGS_005772 [Batillaria attramentaria]